MGGFVCVGIRDHRRHVYDVMIISGFTGDNVHSGCECKKTLFSDITGFIRSDWEGCDIRTYAAVQFMIDGCC